ncbi:hypothetical protein [Nocardioides sp.]|uniref:hypothetical protein n=1 Tax=Nocardioides sp. TaxID=35761 RepID=UPI003D0A4CA9
MKLDDVHADEVQRSLLGMWTTTIRGADIARLATAVDPDVEHVVLEDVGTHHQRWEQINIPGTGLPHELRSRNVRFDLLLSPAELADLAPWLEENAINLFLWQALRTPSAEQSLRHVTGHHRLRLAEQFGVTLFIEQPRRSSPALMSSPSQLALNEAVDRLGASIDPRPATPLRVPHARIHAGPQTR